MLPNFSKPTSHAMANWNMMRILKMRGLVKSGDMVVFIKNRAGNQMGHLDEDVYREFKSACQKSGRYSKVSGLMEWNTSNQAECTIEETAANKSGLRVVLRELPALQDARHYKLSFTMEYPSFAKENVPEKIKSLNFRNLMVI